MLCSWSGSYFQCNLETPTGLKAGTGNPYAITVSEDLGTGFVTAPPVGSAANPETVYFKELRRTEHARSGVGSGRPPNRDTLTRLLNRRRLRLCAHRPTREGRCVSMDLHVVEAMHEALGRFLATDGHASGRPEYRPESE